VRGWLRLEGASGDGPVQPPAQSRVSHAQQLSSQMGIHLEDKRDARLSSQIFIDLWK